MHRVVIVDPDPSTYAFFEETFGASYHIQMASNGDNAIKLLTHFQPDVAVIETLLPDMSGWHLVQKMRKQIPYLPVIAIAATDSWEDARQMRIEAGPILYYAVKPLNRHEMQETLRAAVLLRQRSMRSVF